jgi:acyl-CoA hydrolase
MPSLLDTKVETRRFVYPRTENASETAHGGDLLKWMEQIGGMAAMRFAGTDTLTVGVDDVRFRRPIPRGAIALVDGYVVDSGTSSVTAHVRCFEEDRHTGERTQATAAKTVSVAIDDSGEKVPVPDVSVETDVGEQLLAEATEE